MRVERGVAHAVSLKIPPLLSPCCKIRVSNNSWFTFRFGKRRALKGNGPFSLAIHASFSVFQTQPKIVVQFFPTQLGIGGNDHSREREKTGSFYVPQQKRHSDFVGNALTDISKLLFSNSSLVIQGAGTHIPTLEQTAHA